MSLILASNSKIRRAMLEEAGISFEVLTPAFDEDRVKQITDLGLKYNLLTPYTSFVAVREKIVNPDGTADEVDQPLPMPLGVDDMAVGAEPELVWLFMGLAVMAMVLIIRRCRNGLASLGLTSLTE